MNQPTKTPTDPAGKQAEFIAHADKGLRMLCQELDQSDFPGLLPHVANELVRLGRIATEKRQPRITITLSHEAARALALSAGVASDFYYARKLNDGN